MSWLKLSLDASATQLEATERLLSEIGAQALTVIPLDDALPWEPAPGEVPVAPRNRVEALVSLEQDLDGVRIALASSLSASQRESIETSFLGDQDWQLQHQANAVKAEFGQRLWLVPKSSPVPAGPCIRLDPGLAFGTGAHPTTRLCLETLASLTLDNASVLDYGCGSGILAIAALKLGAASAVAVDYDPQALVATADNATYNEIRSITLGTPSTQGDPAAAGRQQPAANNLSSSHSPNGVNDEAARLQICLPESLDAESRFDLVVANILANPLVELAPRLQTALVSGGRLLLAGLLADQVDEVARAYQQIRFLPLQANRREGDWCLLLGERL